MKSIMANSLQALALLQTSATAADTKNVNAFTA